MATEIRSNIVGVRSEIAAGPFPTSALVRFNAVYVPVGSGLVGGDWYDVLQISDRRICLSIGDVEGHDVESALVMRRVKRSIGKLARETTSPRLLLHRVSAMLCDDDFRGLVTTFFGVLDLEARTLTYSNAGHPPPMVRRRDGTVTMFETGDTPLGLESSDLRVDKAITLDPGSLLVLYTDGLTEVRRNVLDGERMVREAVRSCAVAHAGDPADALRKRVAPHGSHDEVTILTVMQM